MFDLVDLQQELPFTDDEYDIMKKAGNVPAQPEQTICLPVEEEGFDTPAIRNYPSHPR